MKIPIISDNSTDKGSSTICYFIESGQE